MRVVSSAGLVLAFLLLALPAAAQTGKLAGTVTDAESGETLIGATVRVEGGTQGAATDIDGQYQIIGVRPGTYAITFSYVGYAPQRIEGVRVNVDLTTTTDVALSAEGSLEEVVVTADANLVRRDLTSSEARITSETIDALPVQEVGDILRTQAGITGGDGGLHIRGGRSKEVAYFIDGVRVTDAYDGSVAVQIENEGIEELQIISGTFNAEYGQANSGIINVVTKDPPHALRGLLRGVYGHLRRARLGRRRRHPRDQRRRSTRRSAGSCRTSAWTRTRTSRSTRRSTPTCRARSAGRSCATASASSASSATSATRAGSTAPTTSPSRARPATRASRRSTATRRSRARRTLKLLLGSGMNLTLTTLASRATGQDLGGRYLGFRQNPGGIPRFRDEGYTAALNFSHILSATAFYTVNASTFYKGYQSRAFETIEEYNNNTFLLDTPGTITYTGPDGTLDHAASSRRGRAASSAAAWTSAASSAGRATTRSRATSRGRRSATTSSRPASRCASTTSSSRATRSRRTPTTRRRLVIPDRTTNAFQEISGVRPFTFSTYVQDKAEYDNFIINAGLRFDYFDSNGQIPVDPQDPNAFNPQRLINVYNDLDGSGIIEAAEINDDNRTTLESRLARFYTDASPKLQLSPRLGFAYPITETRRRPLLVRLLLPDPDLRVPLPEPGLPHRHAVAELRAVRQRRPRPAEDGDVRDRPPAGLRAATSCWTSRASTATSRTGSRSASRSTPPCRA